MELFEKVRNVWLDRWIAKNTDIPLKYPQRVVEAVSAVGPLVTLLTKNKKKEEETLKERERCYTILLSLTSHRTNQQNNKKVMIITRITKDKLL
jgi:hypothetical protein